MKKLLMYLGWLLFAVAFIVIVTHREDTVNFRGTVKSVEYSDEEKCTYITATPVFGEEAEFTVKCPDKISVKEITGEKMSISDISVGDMLDCDYSEPDGEGDTVTAKWIKVLKNGD